MSAQDLASIGTLSVTPRTPAHRAIQAFLNQSFAGQVDFLAELVRVPSDNPPGDCAPHAERTAVLLQQLGWPVERYPVPETEVDAVGMRSAVNLVVRRRFGPGPVIALNAHGDVVPPGEGWTQNPYGAAIVDGAMFGRGVAVSKSDIATYAFALKALEAAAEQGSRLGGTVELHITYDEESGGEIGPRRLLEQGLSRPDLALGAGFAYAVVVAHNGVLHLEVKVHGKQAHAAMPYTGVDALVAANAILTALYQHRQGYVRPGIQRRGHRLAAAHRRSDPRRREHQRSARPHHVPPRPAHDPRGESRRRRARSTALIRERPRRSPACAAKCGASCWHNRCAPCPGTNGWQRPS